MTIAICLFQECVIVYLQWQIHYFSGGAFLQHKIGKIMRVSPCTKRNSVSKQNVIFSWHCFRNGRAVVSSEQPRDMRPEAVCSILQRTSCWPPRIHMNTQKAGSFKFNLLYSCRRSCEKLSGFKLHVHSCMYSAQSCLNAYCYSCVEKEMSTLFFVF